MRYLIYKDSNWHGLRPGEIVMKRFLAEHRRHLMSLLLMLGVTLSPRPCLSLNLDEAINLAKVSLPSYQAAEIQVQSTEALYKASLAPYFPFLDATSSQERIFSSTDDYNLSTYDIILSYTLFDGGRRKANKNIARLNLHIDEQEYNKNLIELEFNVKSAFYIAMARQEIVRQRQIQLNDAKRDHEVAEGRNRLGAAKLSDVLQAAVRLEQAKFNLVQGQGDLRNALSDLNSLLGRPLQSPYDLDGSLKFQERLPEIGALSAVALERPEIKQAESQVKISKNNKSLETSAFFPRLSAIASYSKAESSIAEFRGISSEDKIVGINATWNIFELGKFYKRKSSSLEIDISKKRLDESKRQLLLDLEKTYQDFLTAAQNVHVAEQQLVEAKHNYSQAFGEYKVGKGDILSLVTAESLLSSAREQLTTSQLNHILSKALIERVAGIESLESMKPQTTDPVDG